MRSLSGRLQRLEAKLAPRRDEAGRSLVDVIRERRHRRLAAEGREPEERPRQNFEVRDRPRTLGEIIRSRRFDRRVTR